MFQKSTHSGSSVELWEENWQAAKFNQVLQFCRIDPLRPLFAKYSKAGDRMLEGGCGLGQYVTFHTIRGVKVVGLDFALRALQRLNQRVPNLPLCGGDVSEMPFADQSFDLYYSGGVVEHFEDGAEKSLREACRVLKKDGVLLISVPYFSPLRRLLFPFKRKFWRHVKKSQSEKTESGLNFFQYAYKTSEFEKMLNEAGLEVVKKQGYAVIWGLSELMGEQSETQAPENNPPASDEKVVIPNYEEQVHSSLLKRLIVSEDDTVPILGLGVRFMRWFGSNMMMYVCKRND